MIYSEIKLLLVKVGGLIGGGGGGGGGARLLGISETFLSIGI